MEIVGDFSHGAHKILPIRTKNEGYNSRRWDLVDVAEGKPYGYKTGWFKILEAISCPGGAVFLPTISKPLGEESYTSLFDEVRHQSQTGRELQNFED